MSPITKILLYIVFLIVFGLWIIGTNKAANRLVRDQLKGGAFVISELMTLLNTGAFFGFIWILTGFFELWLVIVFLIGSQLSMLLTGIIWAALGSPKVSWGARAQLGGFEFAVKNSWLTLLNTILSFLVLIIGYPIAAGIIFFGNDVPSTEVTTKIFQATLIVMFVFSWLVLLPTVVALLFSENVDIDTRNRILVAQIGGLGSNALYFVMLFWAFGLAGSGYAFSLNQIDVTISPILLIALVVWFSGAFLIPHFLGTQRNRQWREYLLRRRIYWIEKVIDSLEFPDLSLISANLESVKAEIAEAMNSFIEKDTMLAVGLDFDNVTSRDEVDLELVSAYDAYKVSRSLDPRFTFLDFLQDLLADLEIIKERLAPAVHRTISGADVAALAAMYRNKKDDVSKLLQSETGRKSQVWVAIGFVLSPIFLQIFSEIGKLIWANITQGSSP